MNMNEKNDNCDKLDENVTCCQPPQDGPERQVTKILSVYGRFQTQSLIMLCPIFICLGMMVISPVFTNIVPEYKCRHQPINTLNKTSSLKDYQNRSNEEILDQCFRYNFTDDHGEYDEESSFANASSSLLPTGPCVNGWIYGDTFGNTIVTEFDLICESGWKRPLVVSGFMFGMMVGSSFGGHLCDRYGRKRSTLAAFGAHTLIEVILSFSPHYLYYVVFMFFLGISHALIYFNGFVWSQELVHSADKRALASFCSSSVFSVGTMSTSLVAYLVPDWWWIYRVLTIISALSFVIISFVSESPTWLLQKGKPKDANKVLKKIATVNRIEIKNTGDIFHISSFVDNKSEKESPKNKISPLLLWKNRILRKRMMIVCYLWISTFLGYYTMSWNAGNFGGNIYVNNLIGGALDIGSTVLMIIMLKKMSRKTSLVFIYALFALFCLLTPSIRQVSEDGGVALALVGRFFATAGMWITILFAGEIFPTLLRSTSVGIASMSARIGSIASPFLIFAGEELDLSIPFYVMSVLSIIGCFLCLLLPGTSKTLPESLEDALALKDGSCRILCSKKSEKKTEINGNNKV